jgi:hypothetical protein
MAEIVGQDDAIEMSIGVIADSNEGSSLCQHTLLTDDLGGLSIDIIYDTKIIENAMGKVGPLVMSMTVV